MSDYFSNSANQNRDQFRREYEQDQSSRQSQQRNSSMLRWGILGGVILLVLIIGGVALSSYNGLVGKREGMKSKWSQVENQMQRRADLIPNLVETVKGVTKQEQEVFNNISNARSRLLQSGNPQEQVAANNEIQQGITKVLALQEAYPQLRSSESFARLQDELAGSENRISVARRDYINIVNDYNVSRSSFPTVIFAGIFGFPYQDDYFKADASAKETPKVKF